MFIEEYEREFGAQQFYIADNFNEMIIPSTEDRYSWLATMGERLYKSITNVNQNAIWVIQGWMFSNQRDQWDKESVSSFLSLVPDEGMLILDMATDYNKFIYQNEFNWDYYDGFYGKMWVYSVIPNMGGKSLFTGVLDYYCNGHLTALKDSKKGNLIGIGMAPEGFENNEMLYEIYTDVFWSSKEESIHDLLRNYAMNRYRSYPKEIEKSWNLLLKTAYSKLVDYPRYNWQMSPGTEKGTACLDDEFEQSCRSWVLAMNENPNLSKSELYLNDIIEASCHLAGIKLEKLCKGMIDAFDENDKSKASLYFSYFKSLIEMMDSVLEAHKHFRLEEWLEYAEKMADKNQELKRHYIEGGRYLLTVWAEEATIRLNDYAARLWGGLLRDYYFSRWEIWFNGKMDGKDQETINDDVRQFEIGWRNLPDLSRFPVPNDVAKACKDLVTFSDSINLSNWEWNE